MNPYRDTQPATRTVNRGTKRRLARRKTAGYLILTFGVATSPLVASAAGTWVVSGALVMLGILMAFVGRSRTPLTRLCSLTWHRGDRLGATLMYLNVTTPRYSKKRLARNEAAVKAAMVGMPKNTAYLLPGVKITFGRDD